MRLSSDNSGTGRERQTMSFESSRYGIQCYLSAARMRRKILPFEVKRTTSSKHNNVCDGLLKQRLLRSPLARTTWNKRGHMPTTQKCVLCILCCVTVVFCLYSAPFMVLSPRQFYRSLMSNWSQTSRYFGIFSAPRRCYGTSRMYRLTLGCQ